MRRTATTLAVLLLWIPAVMGLWLLFVASLSKDELWLGVAFTALTLFLSKLAWSHISAAFSPTLSQLLPLCRVPWYVLRDSIQVTLVLARDIAHRGPAGSFYRAADFECGAGEHKDTRAVLATTATSMTPSIIVLGITEHHMLFHQLQRSPLPRMVSELEAAQ